MNITDKKQLEQMLATGISELTEDDLKKLIDAELTKDEAEIDTEYIDMCFALIENTDKQARKTNIRIRKTSRVLIIAAVLTMFLISTYTVAAQVFNIDPVQKIAEVVVPEDKETTTAKKTEKSTTEYNKTTVKKVKKYAVPDFLTEQVYRQDVLDNESWNRHFDIELIGEYSSDVPEDVIMSQSLPVGKRVKKGTKLVLTYSLGVKLVELPDVVGMTVEDASAKLWSLGFNVIVSEDENSDGIVAYTDQSAGELIEFRSTITLYTGTIAPTDNDTTLPTNDESTESVNTSNGEQE